MAATRYFLAELAGWNPDTSSLVTLYFTDGPEFQTEDTDDPASVTYVSALHVPEEALYGRTLFADGRTGGASQIEISDALALLNADGALDHLVTWGWDGRPFRLYSIFEGQSRGDAILVLSGVMEQLLPVHAVAAGQVESTLVVRLKDPLSLFDRPIQPANKYAGTNIGPDGLEGTGADIGGLPKPIGYGRAFEVPGRPVNTSLLIYQFGDGALAEIEPKWDNGVALDLDADYGTPALLAAASPAGGEYATCLAQSLSMLGAPPAGTVTADISTTATPLPSGDAVELHGTDEAYRGASPVTGAGVTDRVTASLWFRVDGGDGTERSLAWLYGSAGILDIYLTTGNKIRVDFPNEGGGSNGHVISTLAYTAGPTWHHLLVTALFAGASTMALWIDGGNQGNITLLDNEPMGALGSRSSRIASRGGNPTPTNMFIGALAEVWVGWNQFVDITTSDGRERFRSVAGYPVDLGATGARPTGTSPTIYLRGGPDQFGVNLGTGGNLVKQGAPTIADSTPYAPPPATPSTVTAAEIIRDIVTARVGLTEDEIDSDAFDTAMLAAPEQVGIWIGDERSVRDVLDEVANSVGLAYWFRADGRLAIGRFDLPSGSPAATWTLQGDIIELERQPVTDVGFGLPAYSIVVEHSKIYAVQDGNGLAGSVDAARRAYLEREYRRSSASDNAVRAKHPLSPEFVFRTLISDAGDAAAFAANRLALYSRQRSRWRARVWLDADTAAIDLFDIVMLIDDQPAPRFGLGSGLLYRVIGIRTDFRGGTIDFDLWGGVPSPIELPALGGGSLGALRLHLSTIHLPTLGGGDLGALALVGTSDRRITEAGDVRLTEAGDTRVLED